MFTPELLKNFLRSRTKEIQDAWKPIGLTISILFAKGSFLEYKHRTGPYFIRSLAFAVLAAAILLTVPSLKPVRLFFARRVVAFVIDLLLFALGTTGLFSLLFESGIVRPSAVTSMAIVWSWVLLFILLDWAFAGTPGKQIMGLRLKSVRSESSAKFLFDCLARNLLTFVVPLCVAGSVLSIWTLSKTVISTTWATAAAVLSFFPLSIVFFDGQSIPDILAGIAVRPKGSHEAQPSPSLRSLKKWLLLLLASLLVGAAWGFTPSIDSGSFTGNQPKFPTNFYYVSSEEEIRAASALWPYVQAGIAEGVLRDVRISSAVGKLPGSVETDPEAGIPCQEAYRAKQSYKIIRLQIDPATPIIVVPSLLTNMFHATDRFVGRPAFMVVKIAKRNSFGIFNLELSEDYVFCFAGTDKAPEGPNLAGVFRNVSPSASFNELAWLFLGKHLDTYADVVEHVPVYPWR